MSRGSTNGMLVPQRVLVAGDAERLVAHVAPIFSPLSVVGVPDYLTAVAELPRAATAGVVVGIDPQCRQFESAIRAIKSAAGNARVVICCEPAYEPLTRRLVEVGADDYVIFPPEPGELERALQIPARRTRDAWTRSLQSDATPNTEELSRLAGLLCTASLGGEHLLRDMAGLVAAALRAESALVVIQGSTGAVGADHRALIEQAALVHDVVLDGETLGQIRVGRSLRGAYNATDMAKLRMYGTLLGRLVEVAVGTRRWQALALHDDLSGLPNRRALVQFLGELLPRAELENMTVTLLLFDIDDFKEYNDRYGHDAGDELIRQTGQLFAACCRKQDFVCRYGGDEFIVVFWDAERPRTAGSEHPQEVLGVLNRFRHALSVQAYSRLGPAATGCLTCSGGLARFVGQGQTADDLIRRADEALLEAKRAGKNRFWLVGSGDVCATA